MNKSYTRTDLACESSPTKDTVSKTGYAEKSQDGIKVCRLDIKDATAEKEYGKPRGTYITLFCEKIWEKSSEEFEICRNVLAEQIRTLSREMTENGSLPESLLFVGLGNRFITADAIGPKVAEAITVTRHLRDRHAVFSILGGREISSVAPGVVGQTGIETLELVRGAAENVSPDLIIAVDALAARSCDRLCTTVQLSSTGICPGSGIGNRRKAINRSSVGIPVMAIGVPTVVDSSTLVWDALEKAGIHSASDALTDILENGKSFFVTPKETDMIIEEMSNLIASSLNTAFTEP